MAIVSIATAATPTAVLRAFVVEYIVFLVNDGDASIVFSFNNDPNPIAGVNGAFTLNPGEDFGALKESVMNVSFKSVNGSQPFRLVGSTERQ